MASSKNAATNLLCRFTVKAFIRHPRETSTIDNVMMIINGLQNEKCSTLPVRVLIIDEFSHCKISKAHSRDGF